MKPPTTIKRCYLHKLGAPLGMLSRRDRNKQVTARNDHMIRVTLSDLGEGMYECSEYSRRNEEWSLIKACRRSRLEDCEAIYNDVLDTYSRLGWVDGKTIIEMANSATVLGDESEMN